jgi:hypothetical protein
LWGQATHGAIGNSGAGAGILLQFENTHHNSAFEEEQPVGMAPPVT